MNSLLKFSFGKLSLLIFISSEVYLGILGFGYNGQQKTTKDPGVNWNGPKSRTENIIRERYRILPQAEKSRSRIQAAQRLQSNLIPVLQALSRSDKGIPSNVKLSAGAIVRAIQEGKLLQPLVNSLPTIIRNNARSQRSVGHQMQIIITALIPNCPSGYRPSLNNLLHYVRNNVNAINNLVSRVLSGTANLLQGVVESLVRPLSDVSNLVGGTLDSVGDLLGSLLG